MQRYYSLILLRIDLLSLISKRAMGNPKEKVLLIFET